jgi:hypothetical protein
VSQLAAAPPVMSLWAVFVVRRDGWSELEALASPPGSTEPYRLALEYGYGLVAVNMIPAWTSHEDIAAGAARGWMLAPLGRWWEVCQWLAGFTPSATTGWHGVE